MSEHFRAAVSRNLRDDERELLQWMLRRAATDTSDLAEQIPYLQVVGECTCGCPTIDLALPAGAARRHGTSGVVADAVGQSPEGAQVNVIVHAHNGALSELEIYAMAGEDTISLPLPGPMRRWSDPAA